MGVFNMTLLTELKSWTIAHNRYIVVLVWANGKYSQVILFFFSLTILQNEVCLFSALSLSGSRGLQHRTL